MWARAEATGIPVIDVEPLAAIKLTDREKDYAVIGELARLMRDVRQQLRWSRSARDLIALCKGHPELKDELARERPLLAKVDGPLEELEAALDRERRDLMHRNERRLAAYESAAATWRSRWTAVNERIRGDRDLRTAHRLLVREAELALPFTPGDVK